MNTLKTVVGSAILAASLTALADGGFGLWRVSVGGAFNSCVSASLNPRNIPVAAPAYQVPAGMRSSKEAQKLEWDGGAYIRPDGDGDPTDPYGTTQAWRLPRDAYDRAANRFTLENDYQDITSAHGESGSWDSSDPMQFGISIEASRTLWESDRATCGRWGHWGVDFAAAFSYFFQRDVYSASGSSWHEDTVESGTYRTVVDPYDAMDDYLNGDMTPVQPGLYGGNADPEGMSPSLVWGGIGTPTLVGAPLRTTYASGTASYHASGDYRELEMLFMARPWYEIFDWWRVFGEVGLGVSWGCYSHDFAMALMDGSHRSSSEDFDDWSVYGVAGLGTIFRLWDFDLSVDFLARFLRDDVDVNGRYVQGEIERSNWMLRVMLGYEF